MKDANAAAEIAYLSVAELTARYRDGSLSPRDVLGAVMARIDAFNDAVNAFRFVDREGAEKAAAESEARWMKGEPLGPLDGVPASVKDILWVKGWTTTYGSLVLADKAPATEDAPCVARLREAGAILLGMTQSPETGWKGVTDSPAHGITRNPWNLERTPGGSSGGAAAAAALGMGALHIGTDGGGSIRIPAAFTGLFGIKASFGRVPAYPASAFGTVSHVGPLTRTVEDAALMLNCMTRPDARDWYSLPYDGLDFTDGLENGVKGLKIAFSPTLGYARVDPEIAALVRKAVEELARLGAEVEEVDPGFDCPREIFHKLWFPSAAFRTKHLSDDQRKQLDPGLQEIVEQSRAWDLTDFMQATLDRAALGVHMRKFHEKYDLLLTPTLPVPAFHAGDEVADKTQTRWTDWAAFTYPFNLTQQPAASIPCGFTKTGLPASLQIVGRMHDEPTVLRAARAYERRHPLVMPKEPVRGG
ncbi:MAG: amidase [Alphaproteobacteria bacterium]|nr:amidase [Alphaproteobacteria bacterium]